MHCCYTTALLHSYTATLLHCYTATLLLLHYYTTTLLHCSPSTPFPQKQLGNSRTSPPLPLQASTVRMLAEAAGRERSEKALAAQRLAADATAREFAATLAAAEEEIDRVRATLHTPSSPSPHNLPPNPPPHLLPCPSLHPLGARGRRAGGGGPGRGGGRTGGSGGGNCGGGGSSS